MNLQTGAAQHLWDQRMAVEENETNWIRRIAAGEEDGLRSLVAAYGQRIYAYALRLTEDPALADESVQEALIAVWQGAGRFRGEGRVIAWLLGIVHHKAMNLLRKKPHASLEDDVVDERHSTELSPVRSAEVREQNLALRQGMEHLSIDHRAVIELVFYQGLSLTETAEVTGCPIGTVKSRLSYAKNELRGWLVKEGLGAEEMR